VTAYINIAHKLYDRKGAVSGYMVKNGHCTPDEYRVYDAEGNFLYGLVDRQPWTDFRIYGQDGSLTYVGLTRSKHLNKTFGQLDLSGTVSPGLWLQVKFVMVMTEASLGQDVTQGPYATTAIPLRAPLPCSWQGPYRRYPGRGGGR
jgi:hypothetical protein